MLFDGERYLCELTTLLYLNRRTTTERMPSPDLQDGSLRAAVLASDMGFAGPLPGAAAEASAVQAALVGQSQFDEVTFYVGDDCTAQALLDELTREDNGRGLVHLASHATFNPTSEKLSALCLSDRGVSLRELRERIEASRCPPALIVLSACGTGRADLDVEGFSVMLLRNGVGSVVSTLWESIDTSAPAFFGQMYATGFDPNGTDLSIPSDETVSYGRHPPSRPQRCFFGWPCSRTSSLASLRGFINLEKGLGLRFTQRGSTRPGRSPTRGPAMRNNKALMATGW